MKIKKYEFSPETTSSIEQLFIAALNNDLGNFKGGLVAWGNFQKEVLENNARFSKEEADSNPAPEAPKNAAEPCPSAS